VERESRRRALNTTDKAKSLHSVVRGRKTKKKKEITREDHTEGMGDPFRAEAGEGKSIRRRHITRTDLLDRKRNVGRDGLLERRKKGGDPRTSLIPVV